MNSQFFRRAALLAGLLIAGLLAAPAALAHTSVRIGIGFAGPGYRIGIGNCFNCYGYRGYYAPAYYPSAVYYPTYYTSYYPSAYYAPAYYAPAPTYYRTYPVYGAVYYGRGYYYPRHPHRGWYWRGGYYYHR